MNDIIIKSAKVEKMLVTPNELELINKYAIEDLKTENIFTFKVAICDNEVDRDFEVFTNETLKNLAELFVGKTIIKDHNGKADNQVARIFSTEIVTENKTTKNDEDYARLIASCYMVKTESNKDLIAEIKAGIKKEVSVSCRIKRAICSICGIDNRKNYCEHFNGETYSKKECYFKLENAIDAYEVSFVSIPAQKNAGVTKTYSEKEFLSKKSTIEKLNNENENKNLLNEEISLINTFIFLENERG